MKKSKLIFLLIAISFILWNVFPKTNSLLKGFYQSEMIGSHIIQMLVREEDNSFVEWIDNREVDSPEMIEKELSIYKLDIRYHVATDGMKFIIDDVVNELNEDGFARWMNFQLSTCEDRSILGSSEHGLIIAKKF